MLIARKQTLVQLSDELLATLDREAARRGISRSALIREAVNAHLHDEIDADISREIVDAYTRIPQAEEEFSWADDEVGEWLKQMEEEEGEDGW